jgi:hypothetical protein
MQQRETVMINPLASSMNTHNSRKRPKWVHVGHGSAFARVVLHLSVLASASTQQKIPERKLQPFRDWKDSVFLQKVEGSIPALLDFGEAATPLNNTAPTAPYPTPILPNPTSSAPSLSLVNFPSLGAVISATQVPTASAPTPILPATPPVSSSGPPFPLAPGPLLPIPVISSPVSIDTSASASPSENIDYGYEEAPTSVPMSIMPVIVASPSDNRVAPPTSTESPNGPSMDAVESSASPSDPPSDVPSEVPSDVPSSVPTGESLSARQRPIVNATKFTHIHKLPRNSPSKAFSTLNSGKAGGKAGLSKSSKKAKSKKCRGSPKKSKAPSSLTKAPSLLTMSPSSKTKSPHYCPPTSSPYPTITAWPTITGEPTITGAPTTLDDVILRVNCEAMKQGKGPTSGPAQSYTVNFVLIISESVNSTIQRLNDFLQTVVASNMAGCVTDESTNITNVVFDVYEDEDMRTYAGSELVRLECSSSLLTLLSLGFDSRMRHRCARNKLPSP